MLYLGAAIFKPMSSICTYQIYWEMNNTTEHNQQIADNLRVKLALVLL